MGLTQADLAERRQALLNLYAGYEIRTRGPSPRWEAKAPRGAHGFEFWTNGRKATGSSVGADEIDLLMGLACRLRIRSALGVGVAFGVSTFALAFGNPNAIVVGIDDYSERAGPGSQQARTLVESVLADRCPRVRLHIGRSPESTAAALVGVPLPLGLLFIDGLHTEEASMADFRGALPYLDRRSVVLWHDTHMGGVRRSWRRSQKIGPHRQHRQLRTYSAMGISYNAAEHPWLDEELTRLGQLEVPTIRPPGDCGCGGA